MSTKTEPSGEPMVARDATYYRAPDELRARVHASVAAEAHGAWRSWLRGWGGMALAAAVAGVLSWNLATLRAQTGSDERLARELATAHVRSLMDGGHLNDVVSTDQHTVKPWFQGKLDFAPSVYEPPAASGFTLAGGRLDYIDARPVAAITYRHRLHVVNLFEWAAREPGDSQPQLATFHGFSVVSWRRGGIELRMISDASGNDLLAFARQIN